MSCSDDVPPGRHTVVLGAPAQLAARVSLTLDDVVDSRCPEGMRCIWAGRIDFKLTLHACTGDEPFGLAPDAPEYASRRIPGLRFTLADLPLAPAPRPGGPRVDRVALEVTRAK